jgi:hypothetical protein
MAYDFKYSKKRQVGNKKECLDNGEGVNVSFWQVTA